MKTLQLTGHIDARHQLRAEVPPDLPAGTVKVLLVLPSDSEQSEESEWMAAIAYEWAEELADPREDLYTLSDGAPVDGAR